LASIHCVYVSFEADLSLLAKVEVQYETFPGWEEDISSCRTFDDLPENAKNYIYRIEGLMGIQGNRISNCQRILNSGIMFLVEWIGVGASRNAMIHRDNV
jgi:adenylosuccinate synthase